MSPSRYRFLKRQRARIETSIRSAQDQMLDVVANGHGPHQENWRVAQTIGERHIIDAYVKKIPFQARRIEAFRPDPA